MKPLKLLSFVLLAAAGKILAMLCLDEGIGTGAVFFMGVYNHEKRGKHG